MKKLLITIVALLFSTIFAFAGGLSELEIVNLAGTIDNVETEPGGDDYFLTITTSNGEQQYVVEISVAEFERFGLSQGSDIELVAERDDGEFEISSIIINGQETQVDRSELEINRDGTLELESIVEDD